MINVYFLIHCLKKCKLPCDLKIEDSLGGGEAEASPCIWLIMVCVHHIIVLGNITTNDSLQ